ncbi:DegT/DnrJ/EryC1/StrS family aminotransferase [Acidobacteria bacterium AH-259-A15]|nr:DegT/DnrJ/EryC1/StrS family aminotransferase [Acidobacteria bacterium AH-259-A15]
MGCLSFFPSKNLGAYGDAGMVVTDDERVADRVRLLRAHGWRRKYFPEKVGYNSRLDELQAAILRVKLKHIDEWNESRCRLASHYSKGLQGLNIKLPYEHPEAKHVYHLYVIQVNERGRIQRGLKEAGVASAVYYPQPLHLTEPCQFLGHEKGDFPVAERASETTLAIPLYPEMSVEQLKTVLAAVKQMVLAPELG